MSKVQINYSRSPWFLTRAFLLERPLPPPAARSIQPIGFYRLSHRAGKAL